MIGSKNMYTPTTGGFGNLSGFEAQEILAVKRDGHSART